MIKNYITIAVRTLLRHRAYTIICILGMAIGLGMSLISVSYVVRELSWEDCHLNKKKIYRVEMKYQHADTIWSSARVMAPMGETLAKEISGIKKVAVLRHQRKNSIRIDNKKYNVGPVIYTGPEFFDVFTFSFKAGNPIASLADPNSILITDSLAKIYFPGLDPIGKSIILNEDNEFIITGILEDPPVTTQLYCDFIASYSTLSASGEDLNSWTNNSDDLTYLLLDKTANPEIIEAQIGKVFAEHVHADISQCYTFKLKPFKDIYFSTYYSGNKGEIWPGGEYDVLIIVICVGLFILIQAIINFISLSTARAADRMKEVGIRKTFGAARSKLITQFLGESLIITVASSFLGLFFYDIFRKGYRIVTPDPYDLPILYTNPGNIIYIVLLIIFVAILAGYYPALYLSRFEPISVLQDRTTKSSRSFMRKFLTVFQFTLAIFFIIQTVGYYVQLNYLTNYELGFDRENIMILRFHDYDTGAEDCTLAKTEILNRNDVLGATRTSHVMGGVFGYMFYYTEPERDKSKRQFTTKLFVDYNFLEFYGIGLIEGRGFSPNRPEDVGHAVLINEKFKEKLGLDNPIGQRLYTDSSAFEIVGVVEDFKGETLDDGYGSHLVIVLHPNQCRVLYIKLKDDNIHQSVAAIGTTWNQLFGDRIFEYTFLTDYIRAQYSELDSVMIFFGVLSLISLIVAGMGIFGLVLYTVERKTKEMAIRKVLGASIIAVSKALTKEFVFLIIISNVIACPFAYLMIKWMMETYPFQATMGFGTYLSGGLLTILITMLTAAFHIIKAARANPVDTLRYQ